MLNGIAIILLESSGSLKAMLTSAILAVALFSHQGEPVTAKSIIEKMLNRYASASSLDGTVTLTQSAQNVSVVTQTSIAFEKPSKILVVQRQGGNNPRSSILVSNGEKFFFTKPEQLISRNDYLGELVKPDSRPAQTVGDLYAIAASGLPDRSPALDILIARPDDLRYCIAQLQTREYVGKTQLGNRSLHTVKGKWKENNLLESNVGEYELYISDDGDLVRYALRQTFTVPGADGKPTGQTVQVLNTWDAAVTVNTPIKPDKFALRTH